MLQGSHIQHIQIHYTDSYLRTELHLQQHFVTPTHLHPSTQRSIGNCALQYEIIALYVWAPSVRSETHGGGRARNSDLLVYLH